MNKLIKDVKSYWEKKSQFFILDTDILTSCIETLTDDERDILRSFNSDMYDFVQAKVFNRHNDISSGATALNDDNTITITEKSSITELEITPDTLTACNKGCIFHICDIDKELLPTMSFETIADLTTAIIVYNAKSEMES